MKRLLIILLLLVSGVMLFSYNGHKSRDIMRKAPYIIYTGNNAEMKLLWQLTSTATCNLVWGTNTSYSLGEAETIEYGNSHQHSYVIDNLTPDVIYYYKVTVNQEVYEGNFRAAPDENATTLKFMAYGDTRSHPEIHDQVANAIISTYTNDENYQTILVCSGDLVYHGNSESDWDNQFFNPYYSNIQNMLKTLPYQAAVGNHESSGTLFTKYFPYPFVSHRYWAYDYGPAHFVVIDQYTSYSTGSAQLNWIENELATTSKRWKFIVLHEPGWSAGHHSNNTSVQNYIQPLCEEYGVSIVIGGHNHYYARASVNGVQHITTGGGGAPLYSPNLSYPYIVTATRAYHFCKIDIEGEQLHFTAVTPDGEIIDDFTLTAPSKAETSEIRQKFILNDAYPNPFNPETGISFSITKTNHVELTVFNVKGEKIKTMVNATLQAGNYKYTWDGKDRNGKKVSSGIYFYRLKTGNNTQTKKCVLMK